MPKETPVFDVPRGNMKVSSVAAPKPAPKPIVTNNPAVTEPDELIEPVTDGGTAEPAVIPEVLAPSVVPEARKPRK